MKSGFGWKSFTCVCLLVGALFRFAWIGDTEYKDDEDQLFRYSQAVRATHLWPALGTTSGVREIRHPALGIWSFAVLAQVLHLNTPLALTRSVQALSLTALGLLFWLAWRVVPIAHREIWLWTAAFASVNRPAIVYGRKIWIPDLLPIFAVILLIAWCYRHTRLGALIWGIDGALIGQVHMTGFFYSAAVLIATALFARTTVRWRAWLAGSAWGTIPLLPWLYYMWINHPARHVSAFAFRGTLSNLDFFRLAFEVSLGQTAEFNVGSHFREYLAYPVVLGISTQGVRVARLSLHVIGGIALLVAATASFRRLGSSATGRRFTDTGLCLFSVALTGVLVSVADVPNLPHHHLMLFPLEYLWIPVAVTACLPKPRVWLASAWLGAAACTFAFLQFIHQHCGAPDADYGISYRCRDRGASPAGPTNIEPLIRPGQEDLVARMLGRGELLPGSCRLAEGLVDHTFVSATYACGEGRVGVRLVHPSRAPADALLTDDFAVVPGEGSPPAGLFQAIADRVRRDESGFEWLLEARRETPSVPEPPGLWPYGYDLPVLKSRQVLLGIVAGAVILLLSSPWWAMDATRAPRAPTQ